MKKLISISLVLVMMLSLLVGCDLFPNEKQLSELTIYPAHALSAGKLTGYRGDALAKWAGVEAEIWAYSTDKTTAILASGDLPDIMYVPVGETLQALIETGKVLCLDDYLDDIPLLKNVDLIDENLSYLRSELDYSNGKVWGIPVECGTRDFSTAIFDATSGQPVKLKWDAYEAIGAPEIKNFDQLIDIMEDMLEAQPTHPVDGGKMYGTVLCKDYGTYFNPINWWMTTHGYHYNQLQYFCDLNLDTSTASSIFEDNSMYYQGLKWLNKVYQRGLMDPDSISNPDSVQVGKVDTGHCMIPAGGGLNGWQAGGYYEYLIPGTKIYAKAANFVPLEVICINANTENLEGCLAYINMMCNPDAYFEFVYGPAGDMWYTGENGVTHVSRDYMLWRGAGNPINGFPMSDGTEWTASLNLKTIFNSAKISLKDADGKNLSMSPDGWPEMLNSQMQDETFQQWQETTGYDRWMEWLEEEDAFLSATPYDNFRKWIDSETLPDELSTTKGTLNSLVIEESWKMVYAKTDAEFEALWEELVSDCLAGGAQDIINWRLGLFKSASEKYDSMYGK